jgi:hypothetical protein
MKARETDRFVLEVSGLNLNLAPSYRLGETDVSDADLKDNDPDKVRQVCLRIWAAFFSPIEALTSQGGRALCTLALYATGHEKMLLSKAEFRRNEKKLRRFASEMSHHNPHTEALAAYVLKHAKRRALREAVIGARSRNEQPAPVISTESASN